MLGRIGSGQPSAGEGYEMDVLTGCVLGGVSLNGGKGSVIKAFCGILIIGVLSNGMSLLGFNPFMQKMIKGLVLIMAVVIDSLQYIKLKKKLKFSIDFLTIDIQVYCMKNFFQNPGWYMQSGFCCLQIERKHVK